MSFRLLLSRQFRGAPPFLIRNIRTQPIQDDFTSRGNESPQSYPPGFGLATPRELLEYLNQFIVGQESAKKVLSVAVFNHYNRVRANMAYLEAQEMEYDGKLEQGTMHDGVATAHVRPLRKPLQQQSPLMPRRQFPLFEKSNVLVILGEGPRVPVCLGAVRFSGGELSIGKTLLARTLAKVLDVPFSVSDATSFTQAGYVGEDVDMAVQRLLQAANWDPLRASMGIVYIDEVDKIARKTAGSGMESSRDVGGEGVQQALLRMMEGSVVTVQSKGAAAESPILPGGETSARGSQRAPNLATPKSDVYQIDTTNVLFILSGAFVGLDNVIKQRVAKGSIGFTANLNPDNENGLPFFTPNRKAAHNVIDLVETIDLVKYGFIPEFVSRLPSITTLSPLTIRDLRRILTEVKGSLISQYQSLFGYSGVEIRFTTAALDEICRRASERGGGARGLRGIMEALLLEPMYEVPGSDIRHVLITDDVVRGDATPGYWRRGEGVAFWEAWAAEEGKADERQVT